MRVDPAVREALLAWAVCFLAIVVAFLVAPAHAKLVATIGFLYVPLYFMRRRDEDYADYGVSLRAWREDARLVAAMCLSVLPVFTLGYVLFVRLAPSLPDPWRSLLSPYAHAPRFVLRLPERFPEWVVDQLFVVGLPEEFFYRGYLQSRLRDAWPAGRVAFGARLGPAFFGTAALFALGHLAIFQVWRLSVFFPALLFGFMRERTQSVLGAAVFHAICNLWVMTLEASFFGAP